MSIDKSNKSKLVKEKLLMLFYYTVVFTLSYICMIFLPINNDYVRLLVTDVISTLFIYMLSVIYKNTSLYDPYWSVYPLFIVFFWFFHLNSTISLKQIIVLFLVSLWGIRLTINWMKYWQGMKHEDWRYTKFRKYKRPVFEIINLFTLQMMPTFWVFFGSLSLYPAVLPNKLIGVLDIIGIIIVIIAILFETIADIQMHEFKRTKKPRDYISTGLWKYSRHPNYFGEVSFWWGLYLFGISSDIAYWWTIIGPIFITLLFIFISIPLMENHCLEGSDNYKEYQQSVSMLIPWFPTKK
jgi:steroid 5-alpha reductase family enzyme